MSLPNPAFETISPMNVKSGMVAKVYSIALSPTATFNRFSASVKLSRISQMEMNDTMASATGI
jgi:hypothetical protein